MVDYNSRAVNPTESGWIFWPSLFCLHEFGGVFYHYRWGMVAIGEWGEQKLGMDDINKRD